MLLLSIRPQYANIIFKGKKTIELRRTCPNVKKGDIVLIYVSSPVKAISGGFKIEKIISAHPKKLWSEVKRKVGITKEDYNTYFEGTTIGYGIVFKDVWELDKPIELSIIKEQWPEFHPPQSYCFFKKENNQYTNFLFSITANR